VPFLIRADKENNAAYKAHFRLLTSQFTGILVLMCEKYLNSKKTESQCLCVQQTWCILAEKSI